ncbi:hypothetical protein JCM5296_003767 [Sporobolomyces johnsonii]
MYAPEPQAYSDAGKPVQGRAGEGAPAVPSEVRDIQEVEDEGVPRYEGRSEESPVRGSVDCSDKERMPESSDPPIAEEPLEVLEAPRPADDAEGRANIEQWRNDQSSASKGRSRSGSVAESMASLGSMGSSDATTSRGSRKERRLENMTDAEIAQHHFRLAQQHLAAAQRLALAAAAQTAHPSPSAPPTTSDERDAIESRQSSADYAESSSGNDDSFHSPISPESPYQDVSSELNRLAISGSRGDLDVRRGGLPSNASSSSTPSSWSDQRLPLPPPGHTLSTSHSARVDRSPSSSTTSSAGAQHPRVPRRPRTAPSSAMATAPLESASALAPSLYGGDLPPRVLHHLGSSSTSSASSYSAPAPPLMSQRAWEELASNADDDAVSDFHDDQSTFSHVTYATLPPYEDERSSPPPVPTSYGTHTHSAPSPQHQHHQTHLRTQAPSRTMNSMSSRPSMHQPAPALAEDDEFHGFRPRLGERPAAMPVLPAQWAPQPTTSAYQSFSFAPAPSTAAPAYRPHQPEMFVASTTTTSHIQPHSYFIGPNGQPIPVYASPFPASVSPANYSQPSPQQVVPRAPLAIHSQPLQFSHTLPYSPSTLRTTAYPTAQFPPGPPATVPSYSSYNPSSASLPLTTHSAPSMMSVAAPSFSYPRPPSAASSDSGNSVNSTSTSTSAALRSRVLSLRARIKTPHVRFKSPEPGSVGPAARMRAEAQSRKKGVWRSAPLEEEAEEEKEDGGDEEGERRRREKQEKAVQQSLRMLM